MAKITVMDEYEQKDIEESLDSAESALGERGQTDSAVFCVIAAIRKLLKALPVEYQ